MSLFETLPNEVLEHLFSFLPEFHFPLRQVCTLFRNLVPPVEVCYFRNQLYQLGDVGLITHYQVPCSQHNFETILRRGHEHLFKRQEGEISFLSLEGEIFFARASFAEACVQGESRYIIDYLLSRGYVERSSLAYAACKYNHLDLVKELYEGEFQLHGFCCSAVEGDALEVLAWIVERDDRYYSNILYQAMHNYGN